MDKEEQIQRNCEQIQELLNKHSNRKIGVLRTAEDMCEIREKGTKKIMYKGNTEQTLQRLKGILKENQLIEEGEEIIGTEKDIIISKVIDKMNNKESKIILRETPKNEIKVKRKSNGRYSIAVKFITIDIGL